MDRSVSNGHGFDEEPGRWRSVVRGLGLADNRAYERAYERASERADAGGRSLLEDLLAAGVDGELDAAEVFGIAARSGLNGDAVRLLAVGLVTEAVVGELVVAGDHDGYDHEPWDCTTAEAVVRIAEDWRAWGDEPPCDGAIVTLALTAAGRTIGQRSRSEHESPRARPRPAVDGW